MIGERVGNYVVREKLGEGGMGAVYLAEHPQIGKRVALKVLHGELTSNQDISTRFFHEAKAVNDIGHPNIVDILDFGAAATPNGQVIYLVMELLSGTTLTGLLEKGALDAARAVTIAVQVADALAASHERGIVHRDLKPDNIMLVARGREQEFVKLLDFGIAKIADGGGSKTRTGMVMGTPIYMSPEQCDGRGVIDARSDIYALGIVLYEMLTGRVPFNGDGYGEILVKQMTEAPMPMSALRPGLSPYLEQVVMKALQKRPADRFATMRELADALMEPERYVQQHGGLGQFVPAQSAAPNAATRIVTVPSGMHPTPTTLSQSAGQLAAVAPTPAPIPQTTLNVKRGGKGLLVAGGLLGVAALATAIVLLQQRGSQETTASAEPALQPTAVETPPPTTAPTTPPPTTAPTTPAPTTTPPPPPANVTLSVVTTPPGAAVYVRGEAKPRCTSPCKVEAPRDSDVTLELKLSGFADATQTVKANADQVVDLALAKQVASKPTANKPTANKPSRPTHKVDKPAKPNDPKTVGDNTLNPFE